MNVPRETVSTANALGVSRETLDRLSVFVDLLLIWNRSINLVGRADIQEIWSRHILDSLQLLPLMPGSITAAVDLGSGGGFPGLILAIASAVRFDLIEADRRKAAFLSEAGRLTHTTITVHGCRIEAATLKPVMLVTSRALAPLTRLLALAVPVLTPGGTCLFLKGKRAAEEITQASAHWTMRVEQHKSIVDSSGMVLQVSEIVRAR